MTQAPPRSAAAEPPTADARASRRSLWGWALYDVANSAFATTVMAGFVPVFFKQYWGAGTSASESTMHLGAANSAAGLIVALLAPVLGAIADRGRAKKTLLLWFAALGIVMTGGLAAVGRGDWLTAAVLYTAACVGFSASISLYDSLIVSISNERDRDRASSLGYALGYLGGGVLFALNVAMTLKPALFGLRDAADAVRVSFVTVALWWAAFSVPLWLYVPEPAVVDPLPLRAAVSAGFRQLLQTARRVASMRPVWMFLLAYWLYIDGVDTVIRMAVDYGLSLGLPSKSLITALLIVQFVGFPAALVFGRFGMAIGTKRAILFGIAVYVGVTVLGYFMRTEREFYALAILVGLVQGGVQALSRAMFSRLIPATEAAELFGFYNMLGKFATILGPALMGWVSAATGSARLSILSISLLLLAGGALLWFVPEPARERPATT